MTLAVDARLWWIQLPLWNDDYVSVVIRPTEKQAITAVRRQAAREWPALVKLIAGLDRYYALTHREISSLVRVDLIARRAGVTRYQVRDALDEATALCEE